MDKDFCDTWASTASHQVSLSLLLARLRTTLEFRESLKDFAGFQHLAWMGGTCVCWTFSAWVYYA
jgi:hypothetical protein